MGEEVSFWVTIAEKMFGLLIAALSGVMIYFTATSTATLGAFSGLFIFFSAVLLVAGLFLIIFKPTFE